MARFLDLPTELLDDIIDHLTVETDISAVTRTCRRLFTAFINHLYQFNASRHRLETLPPYSIASNWAAGNGQNNTLKRAFAAGISIGHPTLFSLAADNGHLDTLKLLFDHRPVSWKIDDPCQYAETLLETASRMGHVHIMEYLIKLGASVEAIGSNSALNQAAKYNQLHATRFLLNQGACISAQTRLGNRSPIEFAIHLGYLDIVRILLEYGANVDEGTSESRTPLVSYAIEGGHVDIVNLMLDYGADTQAVDQNGFTPISRTVIQEQPACLKMLIDRGCSVLDMANDHGIAPYSIGSVGEIDIMRILLANGAWSDNFHTAKQAMLGSCVEQQNIPMMHFLILEKGADVNGWVNHTGERPLHIAALQDEVPFLQALLKIDGVDIDCQDKFGRTPLCVAARSRRYQVVKELINQGAALNITDLYGASPIFAAVRNGHSEIARLLLTANPDLLSVKDIFGHTPYW